MKVRSAHGIHAFFTTYPLRSPSVTRIVHKWSVEKESTLGRLPRVRKAIQNGQISFPSQLPVLANQTRGDIQWRLVGLYFVRGWSCPALGRRYGLSRERIEQLIHEWINWARFLGYLQPIPPVFEHGPIHEELRALSAGDTVDDAEIATLNAVAAIHEKSQSTSLPL